MASVRRRVTQLGVSLSQLLHCVVGLAVGDAWADESLSARAWREERSGRRGWGRVRRAIDALFWFDPQHCRGSYEAEVERMQAAPEYRGA